MCKKEEYGFYHRFISISDIRNADMTFEKILIESMRHIDEKPLSRNYITHTFNNNRIDGKRFINSDWR